MPASWITRLRTVLADADAPGKSDAQRQAEEDAEATKLFAAAVAAATASSTAPAPTPGSAMTQIPRFFHPRAEPDNVLQQLLRRDARTRFLQGKSMMILNMEDLDGLWLALTHHVSKPLDNSQSICFDDFLAAAQEVSDKCRIHFTASTFFKFPLDAYGRIPIIYFFHYVLRKVSFIQTRVSVSVYDAIGDGYLRESDLENYVFDLIPLLPRLRDLEENFYPFYVCTAVRKFFFFLDPQRRGRVYIKDLLTSPILTEFFELRDEMLPDHLEESNWFSARSALKVYGQYLNLDTDHNGMLSEAELARWGNGALSDVFVNRVFQEYHTYDGEMDYKTFLDFCIAMSSKRSNESLAYFFRVLDTQGRGYLTIFDINFFFRAIVAKMVDVGQGAVEVEDVKDEVFDMVRPADPSRITLDDLIRCEVGETVVSILTDYSKFWAYDNREALAQSMDEGDYEVAM